jgi:hypothetical protein
MEKNLSALSLKYFSTSGLGIRVWQAIDFSV